LQRFARAEEVANLVLYYSSPLSSATNGAAIRVDGGVVRSILKLVLRFRLPKSCNLMNFWLQISVILSLVELVDQDGRDDKDPDRDLQDEGIYPQEVPAVPQRRDD
jgi:hypothetical protein